MAGVIVVWAGSHVVGVGAIVDLLLLGAGVIVLGWSVFEGAEELYHFATTSVSARSERDLEAAADHFAKAVLILGLAVIQAVLLRGQARPVAENLRRGRAAFQPLPRVKVLEAGESAPPSSSGLTLSRPYQIRDPDGRKGAFGRTDAFGRIRVARLHPTEAWEIPISKQREVLYHELVHRFFSARTGPLRMLRAEIRMSGNRRLMFLRYLEEALAEGYAMFRTQGLAEGLAAYRFPIDNGYVTVSQLYSEGSMVGAIMLGGTRLYVSITSGRIPTEEIVLRADSPAAPASGPLSAPPRREREGERSWP